METSNFICFGPGGPQPKEAAKIIRRVEDLQVRLIQTVGVFLLIMATLASTSTLLSAQSSGSPSVILKLDDLAYQKNGTVHAAWKQVFDYLNTRGVKATIGVIASSLEMGDRNYFAWIKAQHERGHEIWNHGYCHCKPSGADGEELREFQGPDFNYQLHHLERSQKLAVEKLGFPFHTFGAPYNATDSLTAVALRALPDIKVWLYNRTDYSGGKYIMKQVPGVNIEYPVHVPDFKKFRKGYRANPDASVFVIQGHPQSWYGDKKKMKNFKKIVEFLIDEGVKFTIPYDYYSANEKG